MTARATADRDTPAFLLALAVCAGGVTLTVVELGARLLVRWRNVRRGAYRS